MWREIWISLITCNSTPFYPIEMGFSLLILFLCDKNSCTVLKIAFEIFSVVTKNRCHLRHHTSQKTQKYLYNGTNIKKNFLQLRCSNVLLHLKYKVPFCELNIKFKKVAGGKPLATDHRVEIFSQWPYSRVISSYCYLFWKIIIAQKQQFRRKSDFLSKWHPRTLTHVLASTLRMRTAISPRQWQSSQAGSVCLLRWSRSTVTVGTLNRGHVARTWSGVTWQR